MTTRLDVSWTITWSTVADAYTVCYSSTFSKLVLAGNDFSITAHPAKPLIVLIATGPDDQTEFRFDKCTSPARSTRDGFVNAVGALRTAPANATVVAANTAAIAVNTAALATLGSMSLWVKRVGNSGTIATVAAVSTTFQAFVMSAVNKNQFKIGSDYADVSPLGTTATELRIVMNQTGTFVMQVIVDMAGAANGFSQYYSLQRVVDGLPNLGAGESDAHFSSSSGNQSLSNVSMVQSRNATITSGEEYRIYISNSGGAAHTVNINQLRVIMTRLA